MKSMFACGGVLLGGVCLLAGCATDTAALFHYDHKYGLVSGTGKVIVPPEFSYIGDFAANGLAIVSTREGKEGFMNTRGRMVIPPIFEDANTAGFIGDNLARVKLQGQWGDLDSKGNFFPLTKGGDSTHPEKRAWNVPCREPNAKEIKQDGKLGLADAEGKVLIPPRFDAIDGFSCGEIAVFREHRKEGLVNDKGEILAPPEFDAIGSFFSVSAWAKKDGVEGYIDRKGQFIFQYSETCGVPVVLDRWSRIIWPPLSKAQICAEAKKLPVNQAKPGDILHICAEAPFPEKDAFCEVRLLDSRADKILVEYQEACTSQHGQGEQDWQWKGKVLSPSPENRADCEQSKTFCLSC